LLNNKFKNGINPKTFNIFQLKEYVNPFKSNNIDKEENNCLLHNKVQYDTNPKSKNSIEINKENHNPKASFVKEFYIISNNNNNNNNLSIFDIINPNNSISIKSHKNIWNLSNYDVKYQYCNRKNNIIFELKNEANSVIIFMQLD